MRLRIERDVDCYGQEGRKGRADAREEYESKLLICSSRADAAIEGFDLS